MIPKGIKLADIQISLKKSIEYSTVKQFNDDLKRKNDIQEIEELLFNSEITGTIIGKHLNDYKKILENKGK